MRSATRYIPIVADLRCSPGSACSASPLRRWAGRRRVAAPGVVQVRTPVPLLDHPADSHVGRFSAEGMEQLGQIAGIERATVPVTPGRLADPVQPGEDLLC